ncbi:MAG: hypothetical protein KatS3mg060_1124 [Dehalococcoidia bacterium]|jgi:hypothetical protein|nr:MAG: hypothetical protein KatS3mg060_1124 [Dehalococcoidia bacterium]
MSSVIVCTNCHRRAHFYSYEWADRSGVLDGSWRCPTCGAAGSAVIAAPASDPSIPTRAYQRVDAVLRALEVFGETTLAADALDRDTLLKLDGAILAAIGAAAAATRSAVWSPPADRLLEPSPY